MRHAVPGEYAALVVAALVLIVVLLSCFMCLQLFRLRKPDPLRCAPAGGSASPAEGSASPKDAFSGQFYYTPSCRSVTAGAMPAIETEGPFPNELCCGRLGVPP